MSHSCNVATLSSLRKIPSTGDLKRKLPSTAKKLLRGGSDGALLDALKGAVLFALLCAVLAVLVPPMAEALAMIACFCGLAAPLLSCTRDEGQAAGAGRPDWA